MNYVLGLSKSKIAKTVGLAFAFVLAVSFVGFTKADTFYNLTVNVSDICGPVEAQAIIVNGPDDGAFGITTNGTYTFNLHAGVFYVHLSAANHAPYDTGAIVSNSDQSININMSRNDGCTGTPPPPPGPNMHNFTVNVSDICGPVEAQAIIVNGPDDGAFGITTNGTYTFTLHAGVFYVHFSAANHAAHDTGTIVLNSNQSINVTMVRTNGGCPTTPPPVVPPPPTTPGNDPPQAYLDVADCTHIAGWATDFDTLNTSVSVEIYKDGPVGSGILVATIVANQFRADVNNHGFDIPTPATFKDTNSHQVYLYALDTTNNSRTHFGGSPKTIGPCATSPTPPPTPTNNPPSGVFEAANCDIIGGWVFDADDSSKSLVVEIYANGPQGIGTKIFSGATTGFRPDVNASLGITGNHGFTISTPQSLKDGGTHEIWVYAQDDATGVNTLFDNRKFLNTAACVTPTNQPPSGVFDVANCTKIAGWATDSDTPNATVVIDIYMDGPAGSGKFITQIPANQFRSDVGNHEFDIPTPAAFIGTVAHTIYAYAIDTTGGTNAILINSPKTIGPCTTVPPVIPPVTPPPLAPGVISITKHVRDLTLGQTVFTGAITANPGDVVEFRVQVTASSGNVTNVVLSDVLPSRLIYVNNSLTLDGNSGANNLSGLSLGNMSSNQTRTILLRATVADRSQFGSGTTTLTNVANATSSSNSVSANAAVLVNEAVVVPPPVVPPPPPPAFIQVTKNVRNLTQGQTVFTSSISAAPGDLVEFQIRVSTTGTVSNVLFSDSLPTRLIYVNNSLTLDGSFVGNNLSVVNIGNMSANQTRTILLRANVSDSSQFSAGSTALTNVANITSSSNSASATAVVIVNVGSTGSSNLTLSKTVRNLSQGGNFVKSVSANPNDQIQFQIQVTVNGSVSAQNVTVNDILPYGLTLVSGNLNSNFGTMSPGTSQSFIITTQASNNGSCSSNNFVNTATATSSNAGGASDSANVSISGTNCNSSVPVGNVNLILSKSAYNQTRNADATLVTAQPNDVIVYTLRVQNQGSAAATNFTFQDDLADVLKLSRLQNFGGGAFDMGQLVLTWPQITIPANGSMEKTFSVIVNSSGATTSDTLMTNVFGNTINVRVATVAGTGIFIAPPTGAATTAAISTVLAILTAAAVWAYRKQNLAAFIKSLITSKNV